jgi:hypothetical protein
MHTQNTNVQSIGSETNSRALNSEKKGKLATAGMKQT